MVPWILIGSGIGLFMVLSFDRWVTKFGHRYDDMAQTYILHQQHEPEESRPSSRVLESNFRKFFPHAL